MTLDEAREAGLLAQAIGPISELTRNLQAEIDGPFDKGFTPWRTMRLEFWGADHADDDSHELIGKRVALPPTMAVKVAALARELIVGRLAELGVDAP